MSAPIPENDSDGYMSRKRAVLAVLPFVALGVADVLLLLRWGLNPLWGFVVLLPILAISVLGWVAFKTGFVGEEAGPRGVVDPDDDG